MAITQEVKDVDQKAAPLVAAADKAKSKKASDDKNDIVWAYVYHTMCTALTTTMMATNQENKAFAATQANQVNINDQLLQYQNQGLNACFTVNGNKNLMAVSNPNNDPNCPNNLSQYYATYKGKPLADYIVNLGHGLRAFVFGNDVIWPWTNLSVTNAKNIYNMLKSQGITGVGFYRQVNGNDYVQADQNNEKITAQRDFLTNELQTLTQGSQLQSGNIGTLGQMATQQIDFIDNVANEIGKLGDQGANQ